MQALASLLLQYWSKIEPSLSKVLSPSEFKSIIIAHKGGLNTLIQWLVSHPDLVRVIKIILGKYVSL
ncbi:hypothetical protein [Priestia aryabhattai]|uniref:hypothetical protein n=1 Tax=Priestia aryabhattai TaxID=412384 RepID=UPI001CFA03F9|nr:hypothetical protein [Priestia aryabhattai]